MIKNNLDTAPFNAAVATLMRLDSCINQLGITAMAMAQEITPEGSGLYMRYKLIRQLFIQSCPLLSERDEKLLKPKVMDLPPPKRINYTDNYGNITSSELVYDPKLDAVIDELEMEIENALQAEGYFMPPKKDMRQAWARA